MQWPSDPAMALSGTYSREMKSYVHTKTYTWMSIEPSSVIAKKLEATQIFVNRWMAKQTVVLTYHGLSNKRDQTINTCKKLSKTPGNYAE